MIADGFYLTGKQLGLVLAAAARAFVRAKVKHLVQPGVKGVRFKGVAHLVHQGEDDLMHFGVQRAVALAVKLVGVGPDIFRCWLGDPLDGGATTDAEP